MTSECKSGPFPVAGGLRPNPPNPPWERAWLKSIVTGNTFHLPYSTCLTYSGGKGGLVYLPVSMANEWQLILNLPIAVRRWGGRSK